MKAIVVSDFQIELTGFCLIVLFQNVISLSKQLEYFKEYQKRLEVVIGKKKTKHLIKNAFYFVSAGTNDFVVNYFILPIRRKSYDLPSYMEFQLQQVQQFMQGLWNQGARRIAVIGLSPMGCLPFVITLKSDNAILHRDCVDFYSSVARVYNVKFENMLNAMQFSLANLGARIVYMDGYGPLSDMTQGHKYEFDEVSSGCCGTGLLEMGILCNPKSPVCPDASKYVFWDSIHPTEKAYHIAFEAVRSKIDFIIKD
uniref:GDSL esterase/lipase n=1 Tax=Davidia involucrata TaxID=16924 RepID=A0A5B6YG02_DAVIN